MPPPGPPNAAGGGRWLCCGKGNPPPLRGLELSGKLGPPAAHRIVRDEGWNVARAGAEPYLARRNTLAGSRSTAGANRTPFAGYPWKAKTSLIIRVSSTTARGPTPHAPRWLGSAEWLTSGVEYHCPAPERAVVYSISVPQRIALVGGCHSLLTPSRKLSAGQPREHPQTPLIRGSGYAFGRSGRRRGPFLPLLNFSTSATRGQPPVTPRRSSCSHGIHVTASVAQTIARSCRRITTARPRRPAAGNSAKVSWLTMSTRGGDGK